MGYQFIYYVILVFVIMLAIRFFLPLMVWLFPFIVVFLIVRAIFKHKHEQEEAQNQSQRDDYYHQNDYQDSSSDIIDVDYTIVDEEETQTGDE